VLDGVTDKTGIVVDGESTGRFAVAVASRALVALSPDATCRAAVDAITHALDAAITEAYTKMGIAAHGNTNRPGLVMICYSRFRKQIWRVGDGTYRIDDRVFADNNKMDAFTTQTRALRLEMAIRQGTSVDDLRSHDVGRECILPLLKNQHVYQNVDDEFGYACLNGLPIPDCFLEVCEVPGDASEIILATDGYPTHLVLPTLAESESGLTQLLEEDPLLFRKFKATKCVETGNVSFDDRCYIRVSLSD
jgi:hypothetical protein